ncbi:adenine phosphoribosyltransferase [Spirochaeta lutea]|uniref:Adenine phosphoribosyltransferase n=1 Tax=Spirochaeta lutea TaxID=1480694 RepID=A0A098R1N8_9SPIO|nr:adenine phosphoribosyltransferase [Spirochaeta lutea]KGE73869.1 adenine phosphoribosyltransferase [Spirochaeta lutea]
MTVQELDKAIRRVPDFPKPGICFYDITSILMNPEAFRYCVDQLAAITKDLNAQVIGAIEARGFLFATPVAQALGLPVLLLRKKGKLPGKTLSKRYALEYGEDEIFVHQEDVTPGSRVVLLDDLIATGGTLKAGGAMLQEAGAMVVGALGVIGLPFLGYEKFLDPVPVRTIITYESE